MEKKQQCPLPDTVRPPVVLSEAIHWTAECEHAGPEVAFPFDAKHETFNLILHQRTAKFVEYNIGCWAVGRLFMSLIRDKSVQHQFASNRKLVMVSCLCGEIPAHL